MNCKNKIICAENDRQINPDLSSKFKFFKCKLLFFRIFLNHLDANNSKTKHQKNLRYDFSFVSAHCACAGHFWEGGLGFMHILSWEKSTFSFLKLFSLQTFFFFLQNIFLYKTFFFTKLFFYLTKHLFFLTNFFNTFLHVTSHCFISY